jgi:serine/threonine-protein kinase
MTDLRERVQSSLGGNYTVEREIGGGGMGRVFLVRDRSLGRYIVAKVLPPDDGAEVSGERFKREIQIAAQLQHANIVPVLMAGDAGGVPYYVMPYIDGDSLRARLGQGPIPIAEVVGLLKDVARALAFAHERGVVHRDIKPDNVLVSGEAAVVTDFGVAKALSSARVDGGRPQTITSIGTSVGTPAYMAPEQVTGDPDIDHRADIYSFGCLAFELITGRMPFDYPSPHLLMTAHISETPLQATSLRSDCPPALAQLIARCLEKIPANRPASAREIITVLDSVATTSTRVNTFGGSRAKISWVAAALIVIAAVTAFALRSRTVNTGPQLLTVLPFLAIGGDSAQAYLADGMSEELATALGKTSGVRVVGRTAANRFRGQRDVDVRAVGEALGVGLVVQGNLRRADDGLVVHAQLTDSKTGEELWADSFQRGAREMLSVRDDITRAIIAALRDRHGGRVGTIAPEAVVRSNNPEAYDDYLRGQYLLRRRSVRQAAQYFERAIARDSNFAHAYAGLSTTLALYTYFAGTSPREVDEPLRRAARRALELDSTLGEPHTALGMAHMHRHQWDSARAEHRLAVRLDPSNAEAMLQHGRLLTYMGQGDSALVEFRRAAALDPFSAIGAAWLSGTLWLNGQRDEAVDMLRKAGELDSLNAVVLMMAAHIAMERGDSAAARRAADYLPRVAPWSGIAAHAYGWLGDRAQADTIVRQLEREQPWFSHLARAYAAFGARDTATVLTMLERAEAAGEHWAAWFPLRDPQFDQVRRSVRFQALLRQAGLR